MTAFIASDNRICALFGIRFPVISGGMVWVSGWRLAAAVSNTGGLGLIGSGSMTPDMLARHIEKTRQSTVHPFGVNVPLALGHAEANLQVCLEQKVPVVFTAAGNPEIWTTRLRDAGILVAHVVPSVRLARKAADAGCHAVVAEGIEAGGHNGRDGITSLILWPAVAEAVSIPVIAAGGIGTGVTLAAALTLGADGVQMGTRFAVTTESSAHIRYKQACVEAAAEDARLYNLQQMPIRALRNRYVRDFVERELQGCAPHTLREFRGTGRSRKGIFEGDIDDGELVAGQVCGLIHDIPDVSDAMARILEEYIDTIRRRNG
jgi:enoyl-[acyl-carrier protein] reductase II